MIAERCSFVNPTAGRALRRTIILSGLIGMVAFVGWVLLLRDQEPRPVAVLPSAPTETRTALAETPAAKLEAPGVVPLDRAKANEEFSRELGALLAGPRMGVIPKIVEAARRWAAADPEAALLFFERLPAADARRRAPRRAVMEEWLKQNQEAAVAFAKAAVVRDLDNVDCLQLVFQSLVRFEKPEPYADLRNLLRELPQQEPVFRTVFDALMNVTGKNLAATEAFLGELPAGPSRDLAYGVLGASKARAFGFGVLEKLTSPSKPAAVDLLQLSGATSVLARQNPVELSAWLETQPVDSTFDPARLRLAVDAHETDILRALQIARQLSDEKERQRYTEIFLGYWLKKDFTAAEAWATSSDLPAEFVAAQIAKVTAPKTPVDYAAKLNAAWEIADDRARRREQYVVQNWLRQDRAAAVAWIKANAKTEADQQFFESMIRSVPEKMGPAIILE
jgi:hypothetical protein